MLIGEVTQDKERLLAQDLFGEQSYRLVQPDDEFSVSSGCIVQLQPRSDGIAEIKNVLATSGSARASLYKIAVQFALDPLFSPAIEQEVEAILKHPQINDAALNDLTGLAFCTIDGVGTRDLDQALYIEKTRKVTKSITHWPMQVSMCGQALLCLMRLYGAEPVTIYPD